MKKLTEMTREERREAIKAIERNLAVLVEVFQQTRDGKTTDTINALVARLGYPVAVETVAELINTVGTWDGRISSKNREWAQTVEAAADREELRTAEIYQPSSIHPAHIDQIADAMRKYQPEEPTPEKDDQELQEGEEQPTEAQEEPQSATESAESEDIMKNYRIEENPEKNGKEIYFKSKPGAEVREALKALRFRWHGVKKCWYGRATAEQITAAIEGREGAQPAQIAAPNAAKAETYNLEGLEGNSCRGLYGSELNKTLREDLKRRGVTGVTIRGRRGSGVTFTITMRPGDFRSAEECAARDGWGEFFRRQSGWGITLDGINYSDRNQDREDSTHKYILCGSRWDDSSEGSNADVLRAYWLDQLKHFSPAHHFIGRGCEDVRLTASGKKRLDAIHKIIDSYNYDNSDIMTDYFDRGFYDDYDYKLPADFVPAEYMTAEEKTALYADLEAEKAAEAARFAELRRQEEEDRKREEEHRRKEAADRAEILADIEIKDLDETSAYFITELGQGIGKEATAAELAEWIETHEDSRTDAEITRAITFKTAEAFEKFAQMLLYDWNFVDGYGGTGTRDNRVNSANLYTLTAEQRESVKFYACNSIAVYLRDVLKMVINPEGYSYARYCYLPTEDTTEERTPEAIQEITEEAKEKEPFYFPAEVTTQAEAIKPGEAVTIYQPDDIIYNIVRTAAGTVSEVRRGTWAQYSGVFITVTAGRKKSTAFIRDHKDALVYPGILPELPEEVLYSRVIRGKYGTMKEGRTGRDTIRAIINHFKAQNLAPILDTVQR